MGCLLLWIKWRLIYQGILVVMCLDKDMLRPLEALCGWGISSGKELAPIGFQKFRCWKAMALRFMNSARF
ncbi:hypothetical protein ALP50_200173 [Pseudomonas syringae pv. spinaceae]|nr:hypothetical protein ALP50_200173 [Pseudomonas syringae pv. spinaceae]